MCVCVCARVRVCAGLVTHRHTPHNHTDNKTTSQTLLSEIGEGAGNPACRGNEGASTAACRCTQCSALLDLGKNRARRIYKYENY